MTREILAPVITALDRATVALGREALDLRTRLSDEFDLPPALPR